MAEGPNTSWEAKVDILFRGQADSDWNLETTLERVAETKMSIETYIRKADFVVNEIESLTGKDWKLPDFGACQLASETVPPVCGSNSTTTSYLNIGWLKWFCLA